MSLTEDDIKSIVTLVGREGAVSALEKSRKINSKDIFNLAHAFGLNPKKKDSKRKISAQIVQKVDKRIEKSLDELKAMSKEDLIEYFDNSGCHQDELIEILNNIDLKARFKTRKDLVGFAAIQISSLGIFERLSNHERKKSDEKIPNTENIKNDPEKGKSP